MKPSPIPFTLALSAAAALATPAFAGADHNHHAQVAQAGAAVASPMSEGTIRKLDKTAGKLTIAHGPLENLNMPPMTMVFKVAGNANIDKVKVGDKIRFVATRVDGAFAVTEIETAQ
jgi:Cu/Ag efflux protein CusF